MSIEQVQKMLSEARQHLYYGKMHKVHDLLGEVCKGTQGMLESGLEMIASDFIGVITEYEDHEEALSLGYRVYPEGYPLTARWRDPKGTYPARVQDVGDWKYLIWIGEVIRNDGYSFTWYQDIRPREELRGFGDFPAETFVRITVPAMNLHAEHGIHFASFMGVDWKYDSQEISDMRACPLAESFDIHDFITEHKRRSPWFY